MLNSIMLSMAGWLGGHITGRPETLGPRPLADLVFKRRHEQITTMSPIWTMVVSKNVAEGRPPTHCASTDRGPL